MSHPLNKNAPEQSQEDLPSPVAPGAPGGRRSLHQIFRESVRVYFLPVTATAWMGRKLARQGWQWLRGR